MYRFFAALCVVLFPLSAWAKTFSCNAGDVAYLIASINQANANGKQNTINLEAGMYALAAVDNNTDGDNGLPSITSTLTLRGQGMDVTVLERDAGAPYFRFLHVAATGVLTLKDLTLHGGSAGFGGSAGAPGGGLG